VTGARVDVWDLAIKDGIPDAASADGQGIFLDSGAQLTASRVEIDRCTEVGFDLTGEATTASVSNLSISRTTAVPIDVADTGMGIRVWSAARLTARCVVIDATQDYGVFVDNSSSEATIEDLTIRGTLPSIAPNHLYGRGIGIKDGASLIAKRVLIDSTPGASLTTIDLTGRVTTTASISDLTLASALARTSCGTGCPDAADAIGLHASAAAAIRLARFQIRDAARAGVLIEPGAMVELIDGTIASSPLGLSLGYGSKLPSLAEHVLFQNDAVTAELPPPPAIMP
jgi:hypothetical protein